MQYDKDIQGEFADIFKKVQEIVLSFSGIKKKKSEYYKLIKFRRKK